MKCLKRLLDGWKGNPSPSFTRKSFRVMSDDKLINYFFNHMFFIENSTPEGFRLKCIIHEMKRRNLINILSLRSISQ